MDALGWTGGLFSWVYSYDANYNGGKVFLNYGPKLNSFTLVTIDFPSFVGGILIVYFKKLWAGEN